jgi:hypothetical protein
MVRIIGSRTVIAGVFFGLAVGASALGASTGCSSSSPGNAPPTAQSNACPATIDATVGAACSKQGQVCGPTYTCGTTQVPITCTCFNGTFQCIDSAGNPFDNSSPPSCNTHPASGTCPASESAANLAPCTEAQVGQQCAYAPQCPGGTMAYDVCTCTSGTTKTGAQGLVFICENSCSGATGPVPDSGSPQPDSGTPGSDAEPDSGPDSGID